MRLDRAASVSFVGPLQRAGLLRADAAVPILMYHSISDDLEPGLSPYYKTATSPDRFREQMQWLRDAGFTAVSLERAVLLATRPSAIDERVVAITFDDGFRDFQTHAWPILDACGFTATVFLPTGFIGRDRRESFKGRECLTWREVSELHASGVSFGSHTITHPVLHRLEWSAIRRELLESRLTVERELQVPVHDFAYPYAFPQEDPGFVVRFRRELADVGYRTAVTTAIGRTRRSADILALPRLPINDRDDHALFISKLSGAYDWLGPVQLILRKTKGFRSARLATPC